MQVGNGRLFLETLIAQYLFVKRRASLSFSGRSLKTKIIIGVAQQVIVIDPVRYLYGFIKELFCVFIACLVYVIHGEKQLSS